MTLSPNDERALEALAAGDTAGFAEAVTADDASVNEVMKEIATRFGDAQIRYVAMAINTVNPARFFDITQPLENQSPHPFLGAILGALASAYESGGDAAARIVLEVHAEHENRDSDAG